MPGGDGTGPGGLGAMTGRAAGYCAGYNMPGYANPIPGRGFGFGGGRGFGRGGGWGRRNGFFATGLTGWQRANMGTAPYPVYGTPYGQTPTQEQELEMLKGQSDYLKDTLDGVKKRMSELESVKK